MRSSTDTSHKRTFRLLTEICSELTLDDCLETLKITKHDLIVSSSYIVDQFKNLDMFQNATFVDLAKYESGEPKEMWVNAVLQIANSYPFKRVIAIGGGAVIDVSKLCVFGDYRDVKALYEDKDILSKTRELIAIPTTCGTGSEVTSVSVVEFGELNTKMGLQIDALFPDKTILVASLLESLPYKTFAITSIDALAHAVESLLSPKANEYTDMFARAAIEGIVDNLLEIRGKHQLPYNLQKSLVCSNMAGIAFSIAGCATMHALSFPLGANYKLAHGEAVYAMFEGVLSYYRLQSISLHKLEKILAYALDVGSNPIAAFLELLQDTYPCPALKTLGITESVCKEMALSVYENQQRLLVNSPITLSSDDLAKIYISCL